MATSMTVGEGATVPASGSSVPAGKSQNEEKKSRQKVEGDRVQKVNTAQLQFSIVIEYWHDWNLNRL